MAAADDEFQLHTTQKKKSSVTRVYIGNVSWSKDLKERLKAVVEEVTGIESELEVHHRQSSNSCHAFAKFKSVTQSRIEKDVISKLHQFTFQGRKLIVQREKKNHQKNSRKDRSNKNRSQQTNGGKPMKGSWTKPAVTASPNNEDNNDDTDNEKSSSPLGIDEVAEKIGKVVAEEVHMAEKNGEDPLNTMIASTAAVTMLASAMDISTKTGSPIPDEPDTLKDPQPPSQPGAGGFNFQKTSKKQSLSALLADYGEEDPNWKKQIVVDQSKESVSPQETQSRLGIQGKAPLHIEFVSFGYLHGAPKEMGGWSHSNPLPPMDCRDLNPVPDWLQGRDGLSPGVKRALDNKDNREFAKEGVASRVWEVLREAIKDGGHGFSNPLRLSVYAGSDTGRHRSVVVCELAAKEIRRRLRENRNNCITEPVSVGTRHRDIERKRAAPSKDADDDW